MLKLPYFITLIFYGYSYIKSRYSALKYKAWVSQFTVPIHFSQLPIHDRTVAMITSKSPWMIIAPVIRCGRCCLYIMYDCPSIFLDVKLTEHRSATPPESFILCSTAVHLIPVIASRPKSKTVTLSSPS